MPRYRCEEEGCKYAGSDKITAIRQHYKMAHAGKPWPRDPALTSNAPKQAEQGTEQPASALPSVPAGTVALDPNKKWEEKPIEFVDNTIIPIDYYKALRQIMHNNGADQWREATISLFKNYDPGEVEALEDILSQQHVPIASINMIMKTYMASMGIKEKEETEATTKETQKKKLAYRDPTTIDPMEIANMTETEKFRYQMELAKYAGALKFQQDQLKMVYNSMGLNTGGQMQSGQYPPEVQAMMNEFKEMKERERQKELLAPLNRQIEVLTQMMQQGQGKSSGSGEVKEVMERIMTLKALDSLGNTKEADQLREMMSQKLEETKTQSQERMQSQQIAYEKMKDTNAQLQMGMLTQSFQGQIELLKQQMASQNATKEDMITTINKALELEKTITSFRGGAAPGTSNNLEMLKTVINGLGPPLLKIGEGLIGLKAGNPQGPRMQPPMAQPMEQPGMMDVQGQQPTQVFECVACHKPVPVYGQPVMVTCPTCGKVYSQKGASAQPMNVEPTIASGRPAPEPSEQEIAEALKMESREVLDRKALDVGLDPSIYANKDSLADALARVRR